MKVLLIVLLSVVVSTSCSTGGAAFEFYVVIKPEDTAKFIRAITGIAKDDGLETAAGNAAFDSGDVVRVVEGRGHGVKLWVQSTPQSGGEDPKLCGVYSGPHPDPAQFSIFTEPRFFGSRAAATELGERAFSQLRGLGFDARREPLICGAAAGHEHS